MVILLILIAVLPLAGAYDRCGDGVCGVSETSVSCPSDCPTMSRGQCNVLDGVCNKDCPYDPDCGSSSRVFTPAQTGGNSGGFLLPLLKGIIAFASIGIIAFLVYRGIKKMRGDNGPAPPGLYRESNPDESGRDAYYPTGRNYGGWQR